ncbi:MAG TPA: succinate dehydrogenase cytochrome b subunit [Nocardioides sp.]
MATPTLVKNARSTRSTIALKLVMAVSGLLFIAFVLVHMYGNLKAFSGQEKFDEYAHHLRVLGEPMLPHEGFLWITRIGLLVALVAHVASAVALSLRASKARSTKYQVKKNLASSASSRTMRWGGATILVFIIWHLVNFTFGKVNVETGATGDEAGGPYDLLVDTFSVPWMTVIYLIAMLALGFHLHHGTWSAMQTLGFTNTASSRARAKQAGWLLAVVIAGGFSLVPLAVLVGIIEK